MMNPCYLQIRNRNQSNFYSRCFLIDGSRGNNFDETTVGVVINVNLNNTSRYSNVNAPKLKWIKNLCWSRS